ncbi:mpv17-like protein 2 [Mizuhopecten yessoensis]|uniref:Mpv17-like protein 2 n=1 Tax=Mizuhopecten yessoensis TaxID=6573 RepID=A0A210PGH7_MIZYE|nr:mpv17-like protein 2 [Mizuhopecten yessoensis]OWF35546.1 Mpv17-like protein 2 [Mizuhopecten yessoensis]
MSSVLNKLFTRYLFVTNTLATGGLLALGDCITQTMEKAYARRESGDLDKKVPMTNHNWGRTGRMFTIGVMVGPFNHLWYTKIIDKIVKTGGVQGTVKRILADQAFAGPFFCFSFFFGMGMLEGRGVDGALQEVKDKFLTVYVIDWFVWPPAQFINFYYLPVKLRVVYVSFLTLIWNTFLSWYKHREISHQHEE